MCKNLYAVTMSVLLVLSLSHGESEAADHAITVSNVRHSYYRGEDTQFHISVTGQAGTENRTVTITVQFDLLKPLVRKTTLSQGKSVDIEYPVHCALLKPGSYSMEIGVEEGSAQTRKSFPVIIAEPPNPQRLPVHYWGSSAGMMDWGVKHGFNTFQVSVQSPLDNDEKTVNRYREYFDRAVQNRINLGMYFYTVHTENFKDHPEVFGVHRTKAGTILDNQKENQLCLREPYVIDFSERTVRSAMELFGMYPSMYLSLLNSEFRSDPCYSERCRSLLEEETGLDLYRYTVDPLHPPKTADEARAKGLPEELVQAVPVNGIIEDNNPYYRYYLWWWKRGMGDVLLNERMARIIKQYKSDVITWHDPFRLAPVYGSHKGLDCIGQWTYTHPDPKYTAYVETLLAGAKPERQMVMPDMTTWEYQNWLAPTDSGVVFIPTDILRENCWIALSRRPDIICHYISSSQNPTKDIDPWRRDPSTFDMMTWMSDNVYKPFGPFILQMERIPRKAAILCSASSVLFPEISRGGWPNMAIYPFYSLLMMAHIPTDVIFDETITRYGLKQYDILFLHQCETLTRPVYDAVLAFRKRGGIVVGDQLLRAPITADLSLPFDLSHRSRQLADLVLKGEGVTADEDRGIMTRYAGELRKALGGKVDRYADSDAMDVVMNVLERGPVRYIVLVNDRRTYGDRFGRWKTFHEKGVAQTVTARIRTGGSTPVVYNVREHRRLDTRREGDWLSFSVNLGPCDGAILAVYPEQLAKIDVSCPGTVKRGETGAITVKVLDAKGKSYGAQPLKIDLTDADGVSTAYSDYYATTDGTYRLRVIPALNDAAGVWKVTVEELTSGISATASFVVK